VRRIGFLLGGVILFAASPAAAADALKFGPAPSWVVPQAVPPPSDKAADRPVAILLHDQQVLLEQDKTSTYAEVVFKIQKPEGLAAGNLSVAWDPASDTLTVNKLEIRRGDQVIDVLKSGQTFTTMRRESNLEMAMLDGVLTANIQPEGLQEGDVVVLATTTEHVDAALRGHVETRFAPWGSAEIGLAHARLEWAPPLNLKIQKSGDLPVPQQSAHDGHKIYELTMRDVQPVIPPKSAPLRFGLGRLGEATDFRTWSDAARIMIPLYRNAAVIAAAGPLRDEVEKIRKASADPRVRTEQALALVQQRTRYVALLMGQGGYVPTPAETTWSRRFGDCKAKTALLLAILRELGIQAEPVAVNAVIGDAIAERLPQIGLFNHVLVRAHIGGKDYWLDGTRTGDVSLDRLRIPEFGWGLPIVDNAALVHIVPPPLTVADSERRVAVDASAGVYAPAKIVIEELYRGDGAVSFNRTYAQLSADQRTELIRQRAKRFFDPITVDTSSVQFDQATGELRISTRGTAKFDWEDGWFRVPNASIAYTPDLDRMAGPQHDAPVATDYPNFEMRKVTITLPKNYPGQETKVPAPVHETLAGVEYNRSVTLTANVLNVDSSERTITPEVPYKTALADAGRLKVLYNDDVYLRVPNGYRASPQDLASKVAETPASTQEYIDRGLMLLDAGKSDEAIADFTQALQLDPKNIWALADRAIARVWKHDFEAAMKDLSAVEALDPNNPVGFRAKGLRAEFQGDFKSAVDLFSRSLEKDPGNNFSRLHRGLSLQASGKLADAIKDFDAIIAASPKNEFGFAARAVALASLRKFDEADRDVATALALNPKNLAVLDSQGKIASMKGDFRAAVDAYSKELELAPASLSGLSERANAYRSMGEDDKALADSAKALAMQPSWPEMHLLRANIFRDQGKRDLAIAEADFLLRQSPQSYALVTAGRIYGAFGLRDKAMQAFDRAIAVKPEAYIYVNRAQSRPFTDSAGRLADLNEALKLDPDNADALTEKAEQLQVAGDLKGALAIYDRVVRVAPDNGYLTLRRAVLLYKVGSHAEAEKMIAARRSEAKTSTDLNNLCWAKATAGIMLESALQDCQDSLKLKPDNARAIDSLAFVKLRTGKIDDAIALYSQAISKRVGSSSYMGRAIAYARKGDKAQAEADRAEALKLDPNAEQRFVEYGLKL
jgi:tetratricopeptide (TPR) repeat protein